MICNRFLVILQEIAENGRFPPIYHSLLALSLALLSYGRSLTFAFFNDDPTGNFAWLEGQTWWTLFSSAAGYGFYRPVGFALWRGLLNLSGDYHAPLFHGLSLLLHGINAALLWQLAYWLSGRRSYSWAVTLLFITFPFNYEAVAYVAALFHPLTTFWVLLSLAAYRQYQQSGQRGWLLAVHLVLLLGLFSHENGLFIPVALGMWLWLSLFSKQYAVFSGRCWVAWGRKWWPFAVAPFVFVLLWLAIPKEGESTLPTLADLAQNLLPLGQTAVYPLLPFISLTGRQPGIMLSLALFALVVLGLLARWIGYGRLWWWGLGWLLLASFPTLLFLDPGYVLGSPRLYYLPGIGAAFLWALPLLALAQIGRRLPRLALQTALLLAWLVPPLPFIHCQMDFYQQASQIVRGMAEAANATPSGQTAVFINVPFFFASYAERPDGCPNPYPWTPQGVVIMPQYAQASDFARINGGAERAARSLTAPAYAPGWVTHGTEEVSVADLRQLVGKTAVFVFDLASGQFIDLYAAWQPEAEPRPAEATFGQVINVVETAVQTQPETLHVSLTWQALTASPQPYTIFVHLYDENGQLVGQDDGPPVRGFVPTTWWQPGDQIHEVRQLNLPQDLPGGSYTLALGIYNAQDGQRLHTTRGGQPLPDDIYHFTTLNLEEK